jgi:hypothetical protein
MRSVLLAWELGSGFGHVSALRRMAERLAPRGFRCFTAVKNVGAAAALADAGIQVLQAPVWKIAQSSATLGDSLGDAGLADAQALRMLLEAWRRIIDQTVPELIIADYAPGACLAARGRIPLALMGNGFTLPPGGMQSFPLLHRVSPPVWPEQQLVETVNAVLRPLQLQPLQRLPQLFSGDSWWVHTFPLLDPYAQWRERPAQGPATDRLPKARHTGASEILVYLSSWPGTQKPFLEALRPFAGQVRIFAPAFSSAERTRFTAMGMRLETAPFRLAEDLASARLVVHLGSEGIATYCVMAGVPQLACAIDVEKELIGKALEEAGIGKLVPIYDPAVSLTQEVVESLMADEAMSERAREVGEAHRVQYRDSDPLSEFETACLKLMA